MSEFQINERRNWKAQTFPYDHYIPDETEECQYCLTEKQAEILRGIIEPLGWKTRWWSDTDTEINQDAIEAFKDDIARRLMMSCCGNESPVRYRYTSEGILQQSTDNGVTWTDAPDYDPRNYSPQFPPMSGEDGQDKKCLAATGAVNLIKEQVADQLTDGMSRYTLDQLIKDWVTTYIETSNPFAALLTVVTNQIFALVIAILRPALTVEVFDTLKCILVLRMSNDASFSSAQWEGVRSDINSQISGIAGVFIEHLVYLLGPIGLTNVARAGGATEGDCSACYMCGQELVIVYGTGTISYSHMDEFGCWYNLSCTGVPGDGEPNWVMGVAGVADKTQCFNINKFESEPSPWAVYARDCEGVFHNNPLIPTATNYTLLWNGTARVPWSVQICVSEY